MNRNQFFFEIFPPMFLVVLGDSGSNDPQRLAVVGNLHRIASARQAFNFARLADERAECNRFHHV
jgi:hypothetical protein